MAIRRPTTLVLGAGASADYGLPIGRRLLNFVCHDLQEEALRRPLIELGHSDAEVEEFRFRLSRSGDQSVDAFLERNPNLLTLGKRVIAASLLPRELERMLFPPAAPDDHWYLFLANRMSIESDEWDENRLSIVTFNYDRSLEHYFTSLIGERRRLSSQDAFRRFSKIPVVHVHGTLGVFDPSVPDHLPYGAGPNAANVRMAADSILVVTDGAGPMPSFDAAERYLLSAERIYFIGFGYAEQNIHRLRIFDRDWTAAAHRPTVIGTQGHYSNRDWQDVLPRFNGLWNEAHPGGAYDFLRNFAALE